MACGHKDNEDCMICTVCGECSESLNSKDICADCAEEERSARDTAILLAALRIAQKDMDALNSMPQMAGFDRVYEDHIDKLCEELNTED